MNPSPLLCVEDLVVEFRARDNPNRVLKGVSFCMKPGEKLCILGRSGSGKTQILLAILGLIQGKPGVVSGTIRFTEPLSDPVPGTSGGRHRKRDGGWAGEAGIRGRRIGMIFQHPRESLIPWERVGQQMEKIRRQWSLPGDRTSDATLLEGLGFAHPERVLRAWPNELSGGEAQRVAIALALLPQPTLLLADEPTSALDALIRVRVMELLRESLERIGAGLILVTHDLALARRTVDRVLVLGEGRIVDDREPEVLFRAEADSLHPGALELVAAVARRGERRSATGGAEEQR